MWAVMFLLRNSDLSKTLKSGKQTTNALSNNDDDVMVFVVSSTEEYVQSVAIRSAVYIGEQNSPYCEEFDGNDFSSTHLLATVGGEPVGTMRVRYFNSFAKLERLAVLKPYRGKKVAHELAGSAVDLCRRKGYTKLYGHCQKRFLLFWRQFGYRQMEDVAPFEWAGHEYLPIWADLEPAEDKLDIFSSPMQLIRPEGDWDRPGVHDYLNEVRKHQKDPA